MGWSSNKLTQAYKNINTVTDTTELFIDDDRFCMIADWVHLAILNLVKLPNIKRSDLHKRLGLDKKVCIEALNRLEKLEFIKEENGILKRKEPTFGTNQNVPSQAIRAFHYKNLKKSTRYY